MVDLARQRDQRLFGYEAHFGTGCGSATLDLLPDRIDHRDTCYKNSLLVVLQIIFGSGLTEEQSLADETATYPDADPCARKYHASSCGSEADDRADPIELCRRCSCTSECPYSGPGPSGTESCDQGSDAGYSGNASRFADHRVDEYACSFFGVLSDGRDDRVQAFFQVLKRTCFWLFVPTEPCGIFLCPDLDLTWGRDVRCQALLLTLAPSDSLFQMRRGRLNLRGATLPDLPGVSICVREVLFQFSRL